MIKGDGFFTPDKGDSFKATVIIDGTEVLFHMIYVKNMTALSYCGLTREFYLIKLIELQKVFDVDFDPTEVDENIKKAIHLVGCEINVSAFNKKRLFGRNIMVDTITAEDAMEVLDPNPYGLRSSLKRYLDLWDIKEQIPDSERYWKGLL